MSDDLLTSAEAARLLRVHPKHLYRLLRQGLPGHRVGRGNWRFRRSEVLAWLEARGRAGSAPAAALEVMLAVGAEPGARCFVGRVAGRWVGHPARPDHGHAADAFAIAALPASATMPMSAARTLPELAANVLVAGCAPLLGPLFDGLETQRERGRAHWLSANSTAALALLADGFVHIAGIHLADDEAGSDHAALVRRLLPGRSFHLVHLVRWRQGLAVTRRNPKGISSIRDLARPDVRVAVREKGSGARRVLDRALARAGVKRSELPQVATLGDHRSVAMAVGLGAFDVGVTVESAALESDLFFVPIVEEAFDLVVPLDLVEEVDLGSIVEGLDSRMLRREVAGLGPYDASRMGHVETMHPAAS